MIAFESDRGGRASIWKAPRLRGDAAELMVTDGSHPAISPDGRWLAFVRRASDLFLRIAVAPVEDPGRVRFLTDSASGEWDHGWPTWSPDGRSLCYRAWDGLWIVPAAGGRARQLTHSGGDWEPAWSPDGRYIYVASRTDERLTLARIPVAGGSPSRLTNGSEAERTPSVSRDGRTLAFSTVSGNRHLVLIDLATARETDLAASTRDEAFPAFSPDSRAVYFISHRWGGGEIWRQDVSASSWTSWVSVGVAR